MQMPINLQEAVEALLADMPQKAVRDAAAALSLRYRTDEKAPAGVRLLANEDEMRAYCAFRMPATYAALVKAMRMMQDCGVEMPESLTDVGSGTGSALWAASEVFDTLEEAHLYERENGMISLAKQLAANGQIATQYVDFAGQPSMDIAHNPNGSNMAIEGILSPDGRVFGKMGHSERIGTHIAKNIPGEKDQKIFESGVKYFL